MHRIAGLPAYPEPVISAVLFTFAFGIGIVLLTTWGFSLLDRWDSTQTEKRKAWADADSWWPTRPIPPTRDEAPEDQPDWLDYTRRLNRD